VDSYFERVHFPALPYASSSYGISRITASLASMSEAIEAGFRGAVRVALAGRSRRPSPAPHTARPPRKPYLACLPQRDLLHYDRTVALCTLWAVGILHTFAPTQSHRLFFAGEVQLFERGGHPKQRYAAAPVPPQIRLTWFKGSTERAGMLGR